MKHIFWLVMLVGFLGCDGDTQQPKPDPVATTTAAPTVSATTSARASVKEDPPKRFNVLLITIDSMRHDMPWHGYEKDIAPNLTKLVKESVSYSRAYTLSSFTSKSAVGILASKAPRSLYRGPTFFTRYTTANLFFPELLQKAGKATMAGHAHLYFDRGKNLRQGFDEWRLTPGLTWNAETDESVTSDKMTPLAIDMLEKNAGKQFFMWLHYMDPHDQYIQHAEAPKFGRRARNLYDAEMWYTDMWIQKLFDWCAKHDWWKNTVVIISSDHGEAFGEHDMWKHAFALWEVLTKVPLIFKVPGVEGRVIDERRSHLDLAPTIMELMGEKPDPSFTGKSMVPELFGGEPDNREPIILDIPADTYNPNTRVAIKGDYKLIEDPGPKYKLFNLTEDPDEKLDLAKNPKHKKALEDMKKAFEEAWAKHPYIAPYGGRKLTSGMKADGPVGPPGFVDPEISKNKKK